MSAYGITVAVTMFVTDISMGFAIAWVWKFHWRVAVVGCLPFIFVDGIFLTSNFTKLSGEPQASLASSSP